MTLFELVKIALDELYAEGQATYGSRLDKVIMEKIAYLQDSYGKLSKADRAPVNYKDPATRFAYVYKYVATHGDYLVQILNRVREKGGNIFQADNVRISCVGGGPGSDIIAVLKYLIEHHGKEPVKKATFYLLDREQSWADTWTELDQSLDADVGLNVNFQPLDVTNPASWESQRKFLQADLFTLSYFVSEVMALDGGVVSKFWGTLFDSAKKGALFVYDDNGHGDFNDYFDKQWKTAKMKLVDSGTNVEFKLRHSEDKKELEKYRAKFDHNPKLKGMVSFRILRKP